MYTCNSAEEEADLMPDAAMVGMPTAWEMAAVAASVGAAFSIRPCMPPADGFIGMPPLRHHGVEEGEGAGRSAVSFVHSVVHSVGENLSRQIERQVST